MEGGRKGGKEVRMNGYVCRMIPLPYSVVSLPLRSRAWTAIAVPNFATPQVLEIATLQ